MIKDNIKNVKANLNENTNLIVVTKTASIAQMKELLSCGINNFGENRTDIFLSKYESLKEYPICWHFTGHLQKNKCKTIINKIAYLHSLESLDLAKCIERYRIQPLKCFIQVNICKDENKYGIEEAELEYFMDELKNYPKVQVVGLMCILKEGYSKEENLYYFKRLKALADQFNLDDTSMGMSGDYKEAIQAGATYIRLGSIIVGEVC